MRIITRQVRGGFRARFDSDEEWVDGKSKSEAIGNLFMSDLKRFGIQGVDWDMGDTWTRNYVNGKPNRSPNPPAVDFDKLPRAENPGRLRIYDLPTSGHFRNTLSEIVRSFGHDGSCYGKATLDNLCQHTESEIVKTSSLSHSVGKKTLEHLHGLLNHYGLALREE